MQSRMSSPILPAATTFRLNLSPTQLESGLRFQDNAGSKLKTAPISGPGDKKLDAGRTVSINVGSNIARMVFASQVLIVTTLAILIFTMLFMSYRFNYNVNWYYDAAQPYLTELRDRGMDMARNADASSLSLAHVMSDTERMARSSIPDLIRSVNSTTSMVSRLEEVVKHPTIKLSLGA